MWVAELPPAFLAGVQPNCRILEDLRAHSEQGECALAFGMTARH